MKLVLHPDPHPLQREMTEGANIEQSDRELIPRLIPQKGPQSEWVMITEGHHLMFKKHMRLMQDIVKRSQKSWYSTTIEEVTSAACIGMIYAIVTWDPEKNFQFSTWATTIIRNMLKTTLGREVPFFGRKRMVNGEYVNAPFVTTGSCSSLKDENEDIINQCLEKQKSGLGHFEEETIERAKKIFEWLQTLASTASPTKRVSGGDIPRNARIALTYWRDGKSLSETGAMFGVTRERVRQILGTVKKLVRQNFPHYEEDPL